MLCLSNWKINPHHKWHWRWEFFLLVRPGVKLKALPKFLAHSLCWQNPSCRWDFAFSVSRCDFHLSKRIFPSGLPHSAPGRPQPHSWSCRQAGQGGIHTGSLLLLLHCSNSATLWPTPSILLQQGQRQLSSSSSALFLPWQPGPAVPPRRMPLLGFHGFWLEQHKAMCHPAIISVTPECRVAG